MSRIVSRKGTKKPDFKMSFSYETGMKPTSRIMRVTGEYIKL